MKSSIQLLLLYSFLFISLNCSFQSTLFKEMNNIRNGENFVISPLSIFQILSLTTNGAKGITQKEMLEALEVEDIETLNKINYEILEVFKNFTTVEMANAVMTKFTPLAKFTEISEKYCAPTQILESAKQVNDWCSEKTHGKINSIIDKLNDDVVMILLNAIYFKGEWKNKFQKQSTTPQLFYNLGKVETQIDTMYDIDHYNYFEDSKIQAVELPFTKDLTSAVIILPKNDLNINDYISSLTSTKNHLFTSLKKLSFAKVHLELPKFELNLSTSIKNELGNLGLLTAFKDNADFSALTDKSTLKIDDVLHKTYLKVNEDGTEAAAVTAVIGTLTSLPFDEVIYEMKVNKPFLFLLKSRKLPEDHNMLFMAKIEKLN